MILPRLLALLLSLAPSLAVAAPIVCPDPNGGADRKLQLPKIKQAVQKVKSGLAKKGLHVLDLTAEALGPRRAIESAVNEERWCAAEENARLLETDLSAIVVDAAFVNAKVVRAGDIAKAQRDAKVKERGEKAVAKAAELAAAGKLAKANSELNAVLFSLLGNRDPWALPTVERGADDPPAAPSGLNARNAAELDDSEVEQGCPALGRRAVATSPELAAVMERLRSAMNRKSVRTVDIQHGEELARELGRHLEHRELGPAARIACALFARVSAMEPDLKQAMARFHRVTRLRDEKGIPQAARGKFSELVRVASDQLAKREFAQAQATLDELLVLLGEPVQPADTLPRG